MERIQWPRPVVSHKFDLRVFNSNRIRNSKKVKIDFCAIRAFVENTSSSKRLKRLPSSIYFLSCNYNSPIIAINIFAIK